MRQQHKRIVYCQAELNPTEVPLNISQETNQPQEEDNNSSQASLAGLVYDRTKITNRPVPIQPVEPVVGLTLKSNAGKKRILTSH